MKKTLKKLTSWLFVFVMIFSFVGCESETGLDSKESECAKTVETLQRYESSEELTVGDGSTDVDTYAITSTAEKAIEEEPSEEKTATTQKSPVKTAGTTSNTESTQNSSITTWSKKTNKKTEVSQSKDNNESETTSSTPDHPTTSTPNVAIPAFTKAVYAYEHENIETTPGSDNYVAYMSVYCINDNTDNRTSFENKFKILFGFMPTAKINSLYIGEFLVNGYEGAQKVYQYTIEDKTYPLITDEFYVVKKKICADGSGWCGFPVPCSMDNLENSSRVKTILKEMHQLFCEWYGVDYSYAINNPNKFMINKIAESKLMRTVDGHVLNVIYRFDRGVEMPIEPFTHQ